MKLRLDKLLTQKDLAPTRSQAENLIRLGQVKVDGRVVLKPGHMTSADSLVEVAAGERYVSRAGLKLASVAELLRLNFRDKIVLDVGSSTGGFTDFVLKRGAKKVYAVDIGTEQLHRNLRREPKIELHEKTDIRDFYLDTSSRPELILIDVSFISLREILPHIASELAQPNTKIIAMVKPQFEAGRNQTHKGIIKNENVRRRILKDFEIWAKDLFVTLDKRDSEVAGAKGNRERFYVLKPLNS